MKKPDQKFSPIISAGREIPLGRRTLIMGILNVTPDSFSDGGDHNLPRQALEHAKVMIEEGADIIDVGGESTRPGSREVGSEEELVRVIPAIELLSEKTDCIISIDSYKAEVAAKALAAGAHMVNDVWGFQKDPEIVYAAKEHGAAVIAMHNQQGTEYNEDIMSSIIKFLERSVQIALDAGIPREHIILDPGIGFGKTAEQNMDLMYRLDELAVLGQPILLGTSRKSMIGKILDVLPKDRVEGTVATTAIGIMQGVEIVRVHDVKENREAALVSDAIMGRYRSWM
jgi:dihydropteroate synthase